MCVTSKRDCLSVKKNFVATCDGREACGELARSHAIPAIAGRERPVRSWTVRRLLALLAQPHAAPTCRAVRAVGDQYDPEFIERADQLHERVDIAANDTVAGFHALNSRD